MDIGRASPRHEALALLYPRSKKLQSHLFEYFVVVVGLCRHIHQFGQKSTLGQLASALNDAKLQPFRSDLDYWAINIKEESALQEHQESSGFRALLKKTSETSSQQRNITAKLRVLDYCSTYNHQTSLKQTKKAGRTSFFEQRAEYQMWKDSSKSCTLVCTGKLGSGKSVMLANIVDDLVLSTARKDCTITYFFCRDDIRETLRAQTVFGCLARQLLSDLPGLVQLCESLDFTQPNDLGVLSELLQKCLRPNHEAYIVLDGLDECDKEEKESLLAQLLKLQETFKVRVCISIRLEPHVDPKLITERLANGSVLLMPDENPDIVRFIAADLERCLANGRLVLGDPRLVWEIEDALVKGSQGMFLWATLQVQSICGMKTDRAIREALADLPRDLPEIFRRILHKSGSGDRALQEKVLKLVLAAYTPLTTEQLREALSVTPGDSTWDSSRVLNDVTSALASCGCLLVVDEEEFTVTLVHHSVRQYILGGASPDHVSFTLTEAHMTMADIVVTYLGYGVFGTEIATARVQPVQAQVTPSRIVHATLGPSSTIANMAQKLLRSRKQPDFDIGKVLAESKSALSSKPGTSFKFHVYAKAHWAEHVPHASFKAESIFKLARSLLRVRFSELKTMTGEEERAMLYFALEIAGAYKTYLNSHDGSLLVWAIREGRTTLIELLSQRSHTNHIGATKVGLLELFLGDLDLNARDHDGDVAWSWVARYLDTDRGTVDFDKTDDEGRTLLHCAACNGLRDVVELLLSIESGDANAKNERCNTPLSLAVTYNHTNVVEVMIRSAKVDVEATGSDGYTPLILAVIFQRKDLVDLLLMSGRVNVEAVDGLGRTPLTLAALDGNKEIVELLVTNGRADVEARDSDGKTPLALAVMERHEDVVELLLETGNADAKARDSEHQTPLHVAATKGYTDIVELLLINGRANVEAHDRSGKTPLIWAVMAGHKNVVELLLTTGKAEANTRDTDGWTLLHIAAMKGYKEITGLLLNTSKVDINAKDYRDETPLHKAAKTGKDEIVDLFLNTGKADLNMKAGNGKTPKELAAERGHGGTVMVFEAYEMRRRVRSNQINRKLS